MNFDETILRNEEKAVYALRRLYLDHGYNRFKMSKFEEYDLYSRNKEFLVSEGVISFTDTDGKLMALKPDVTLSIVNNAKDQPEGVEKLYYNENVYRISGASRSYKEIMQTGIECIGAVQEQERLEVTLLAAKSLALIGADFRLCLSHAALVSALLEEYKIQQKLRSQMFTAIKEKNDHLLRQLCTDSQYDALQTLLITWEKPDAALSYIRKIANSDGAVKALQELEQAVAALNEAGFQNQISVDFSITDDDDYYNGIIFKGYVNGIAERVLSGGQYDKLMEKMGKKASAIGFAVYLDTLERYEEQPAITDRKPVINVALPKGRLGEKVYAMFEAAGMECPAIKENNRKLIFDNEEIGIRFFWVKPSDVAIYVERGAADIGVAGKDILLEYAPDVYELLDLGIGKCRMAVAAPEAFRDDPARTLRVATKFSRIARNYYESLGREIDIIHLTGSIEIAPIIGLSDVIVDIVETGTTLRENHLEVRAEVIPISARLIANKAGYKFKGELVDRITAGIAAQVNGD